MDQGPSRLDCLLMSMAKESTCGSACTVEGCASDGDVAVAADEAADSAAGGAEDAAAGFAGDERWPTG